jgi:hypothetical protein
VALSLLPVMHRSTRLQVSYLLHALFRSVLWDPLSPIFCQKQTQKGSTRYGHRRGLNQGMFPNSLRAETSQLLVELNFKTLRFLQLFSQPSFFIFLEMDGQNEAETKIKYPLMLNELQITPLTFLY